MTDVLPSCIGMEGLLYQLCSGFMQANKSHQLNCFQLVRINPSGGGNDSIEINAAGQDVSISSPSSEGGEVNGFVGGLT